MECPLFTLSENCTDLSNISTMYIELTVGLIAAVVIGLIFYLRQESEKNKRSDRLLLVMISDTLIPLRNSVMDFLDLYESETKKNTLVLKKTQQDFAKYWNNIQGWKVRLSPLFAVSGGSLKENDIVTLSKIIETFEIKLSWVDIAWDIIPIYGFKEDITNFLKEKKKLVIQARDEKNKPLLDKVIELNQTNRTDEEARLKERWQFIIDENNKTISDILD